MSDPKEPRPPTPEEIARKLQEMFRRTFGDNVVFPNPFSATPPSGESDSGKSATAAGSPEADASSVFDFRLLPRDIKAHLDRFVIRQEEAKKVLSIAVCDHYNRARHLRELAKSNPDAATSVEYVKQNVLISGPTGVGKTYLVKHIAELIGVPFVKADATKFSETGYVGGDVDDLVRELVQKADGDIGLAEYGIIYIDEIDKLATRGNMMGRDVSGRGVQTALLKLMEETEVSLRSPMDLQGQMQMILDMQSGRKPGRKINTRNILFIVSGAFAGIGEIIARRTRQGRIGFNSAETAPVGDDDLYRLATTRDFIEFGFEPEFIGRLPVRVVCDRLSAEDIGGILRHSEGSLLRQYEREFAAYGIELEFREDAIDWIAAQAAEEDTGARGLLTVCEGLLRDFKFELPGSGIRKLVVDRELIDNREAVLERLRKEAPGPVSGELREEVERFVGEFREQHGVTLRFTGEALEALARRERETGRKAGELCHDLFRDWQFALKLIERNTGRREFTVTPAAVADPEGFISDLVVQSYQR